MKKDKYYIASQIFTALGHPVRLALMEIISESPSRVQDLVDAVDLPQPTVSQHLRVLRSYDLVDTERHGREIIYQLKDEHITHIVMDALKHANE